MYRQTARQAGRQTDRQTDRYTLYRFSSYTQKAPCKLEDADIDHLGSSLS